MTAILGVMAAGDPVSWWGRPCGPYHQRRSRLTTVISRVSNQLCTGHAQRQSQVLHELVPGSARVMHRVTPGLCPMPYPGHEGLLNWAPEGYFAL